MVPRRVASTAIRGFNIFFIVLRIKNDLAYYWYMCSSIYHSVYDRILAILLGTDIWLANNLGR